MKSYLLDIRVLVSDWSTCSVDCSQLLETVFKCLVFNSIHMLDKGQRTETLLRLNIKKNSTPSKVLL